MALVHVIAADGRRHELDARAGVSLMQAATAAGIDGIAADCGGCLSCATCHVYIDETWLDRLASPHQDELSMLEMTAAERRPTSRLSCQLIVHESLHGLVVQLPSHQY